MNIQRIKNIFKKEKPTVEYYKKLDKFVYVIAIMSILVNGLAGAISLDIYGYIDVAPLFMMFSTVVIYIFYMNNSLKVRTELKNSMV